MRTIVITTLLSVTVFISCNNQPSDNADCNTYFITSLDNQPYFQDSMKVFFKGFIIGLATSVHSDNEQIIGRLSFLDEKINLPTNVSVTIEAADLFDSEYMIQITSAEAPQINHEPNCDTFTLTYLGNPIKEKLLDGVKDVVLLLDSINTADSLKKIKK